MSEKILETVDLTCAYGEKKVLRRINFSVDNNEFLGIIGPNASGKTTLLRTIDRVMNPEKGTVFLDGEDMNVMEKGEIAKKMGVVPQEFSTNYSLTSLEIVMMGRTPHLGPLEMEDEEDMKVVKDAMQRTDTWKLAHRPFSELSGGEKQRVIIAKALAQEPSLLLLDEPINHLDINNQLEVLDLVRSLTHREGKSIIATFHDLNIAARYCDSLILLHDKEIYAQGTPDEVLTEENIKEIYGADASVRKLPETNSVIVTPISEPRPEVEGKSSELQIHLVCGGGSGKALMHTLSRSGYELSTGVLSPLDDDYREAKRLGIKVVSGSPFQKIGKEAADANKKLIKKSDILIFTNLPIGNGNLKNLELVHEVADEKPVILVEKTPIEERDFTGGKAEKLYQSLKEDCAGKVTSSEEVLPLIKEHEGTD